MNAFTALIAKLFKDKHPLDPESTLCPLPRQLDLASLGRVQVFAPHPDDESIGCGGLLALLAQRGCEIQVVLVTDGGGAGGLPPEAAQTRQQEFIAALGVLGIGDWRMLNFPDGAIKQDAALTAVLAKTLADFKPDTVIMPSMLDLHRDHRIIATTLLEGIGQTPSARQYIQYEVWCPLPATHIVDISTVATTKWQAIRQHATALACGDYLTASEGLANYRGLLLGQPGQQSLAEAFVVESARYPNVVQPHWLTTVANNMLRRIS